MGTKGIFDATGAPQSNSFHSRRRADQRPGSALAFVGGYPTDDTVQKVYDGFLTASATQLYLDMYPALSMHGMLTGVVRDYGVASCSDVCATADRLDSKALFLTGNTESIYAFIVVDTKVDGTDRLGGAAGRDGTGRRSHLQVRVRRRPDRQGRGQGREVPRAPPGYDGDVPDGYFVFRSPTYVSFSSSVPTPPRSDSATRR